MATSSPAAVIFEIIITLDRPIFDEYNVKIEAPYENRFYFCGESDPGDVRHIEQFTLSPAELSKTLYGYGLKAGQYTVYCTTTSEYYSNEDGYKEGESQFLINILDEAPDDEFTGQYAGIVYECNGASSILEPELSFTHTHEDDAPNLTIKFTKDGATGYIGSYGGVIPPNKFGCVVTKPGGVERFGLTAGDAGVLEVEVVCDTPGVYQFQFFSLYVLCNNAQVSPASIPNATYNCFFDGELHLSHSCSESGIIYQTNNEFTAPTVSAFSANTGGQVGKENFKGAQVGDITHGDNFSGSVSLDVSSGTVTISGTMSSGAGCQFQIPVLPPQGGAASIAIRCDRTG
jgi:hypothetical protein